MSRISQGNMTGAVKKPFRNLNNENTMNISSLFEIVSVTLESSRGVVALVLTEPYAHASE